MRFDGAVAKGNSTIEMNGQTHNIPQQLENASGKLVFGVRPEHINLSDTGEYRGEIIATEYLGTTQIITLDTPNGTVKARAAATQAATVGDKVALSFQSDAITLFDNASGRALRSQLNNEVLSDG